MSICMNCGHVHSCKEFERLAYEIGTKDALIEQQEKKLAQAKVLLSRIFKRPRGYEIKLETGSSAFWHEQRGIVFQVLSAFCDEAIELCALLETPAPGAKEECFDCDADTDDGEWKARHTNKPPCKYAEEDGAKDADRIDNPEDKI